MKKLHTLIASITIVGTSVLLTACGNSQQANEKSHGKYAGDQTLNWTESSNISTIDASKATDTLSFNVLLNTQEGLYRLDKNGKPQNALAVKTDVSNNGKKYVFHLRKNVKWSNGQPVTAKDFVYSWQRTVNPKTASQDAFYLYPIVNASDINAGKKPISSLGAKAIDDYTLELNLNHPVSYLNKLLAWPLFFPINQSAVNEFGNKYGTQARYTVSNGPFKLNGWTGTNKQWSLVKNNKYWDHKNVHLAKINEIATPSTTTSYNLYTANKVDETLLSGQQVKNNLNNKELVQRLPTATSRLDLNQNKIKAFKNLDIRKAISLAIDRNALAKDILQDGSKPSKGFVPAGMGKNPKTNESFDDEAYVKNTADYNLKLAKSLIQKGYKDTGTNKLQFNILTSDTDSSKSTVEYLQSALQKLPGVSVSITSVPFVQLITRQNSGDYEATTKSWQSVFADPINYLDVYESNSSYNHTGWKNKTFDKLLVDAEIKYGNQPEKRWNNLVKAEQILMNEQGTIPLYQVAKSQLLRSNVKDVVYNPAGVPYDWKNAYISK